MLALGFVSLDLDGDGSLDDIGDEDDDGVDDDDADTMIDEDPPALSIRYFDGAIWVNGWDSYDPGGWDADGDGIGNFPGQYRRLPQAVQVRLTVVDTNDVLNPAINPEANPYVLSRIILVGTQSTGQ